MRMSNKHKIIWIVGIILGAIVLWEGGLFAYGYISWFYEDKNLWVVFQTNITSDEAMPWHRIYEEIAAAVGVAKPNIVKVPLEFICEHFPELVCWLKGDKAEPAVFDNSKIKRFVPDFVCRKPFREVIRESVNWMRAHSDQKKHNPKVDDYCDRVVAAWLEAQKEG